MLLTFKRHETTKIGIELGSYEQTTHVESISDVVHLHNIER